MAARRFAIVALVSLAVCLGCILHARPVRAQIMSMDAWLKMTEHQGTIPPGTTITMKNWQQYKQFMPPGMIALFEGKYFWKMPKDVKMEVGPTVVLPLPKGYVEATEKYGGQTRVVHLPNGLYSIANYTAGEPFPNPQEPDKGYKLLADGWFAPAAHLYVHSPETGMGSFCTQDRFGSTACIHDDIVYRQLAFNSDPGVPRIEPLAAGMYYTEWLMIETPEQSKYTTDLTILWQDPTRQEDDYVFIPALRRSLRLSVSARCAPLFGSDMTHDDQRTGYNAGLGIMQAKYLGTRKILGITDLTTASGKFPGNFDMPLGWPKASWGKWSLQNVNILDVRRIPSQRAGYCYGKRIIFGHARFFYPLWEDLYDANMQLWKVAFYGKGPLTDPASGDVYAIGNYIEQYWDIQNDHASYIFGSDAEGRHVVINSAAPKQYDDIPRYSTPAGLMQIMR